MPKATITAVVNQKGGTAKTTTSENLGFGLAREGKRVLLVDTDPQASLTIALGNPQPDNLEITLTDLMKKVINEEPIAPGEGILHHPEGVDLVPSSIELSGMEVSLVNTAPRRVCSRHFRSMYGVHRLYPPARAVAADREAAHRFPQKSLGAGGCGTPAYPKTAG